MAYTYRGYTLNSYKDYPNFAVEAAKDQAILALLPPNGSSYVSTEHYHARLARPTSGTPVVTVDDTGVMSVAGYGVGYMYLGGGGAVTTVTGVYGITGSQGVTGVGAGLAVTGVQGVTGLVGVTGVQGVTGLPGSAGGAGSQGLTGAQGHTGSAGVTGLRGLTGVQGVTGLIGLTGAGGLGVTGLTQYHLPVADAAGNLVDSYLTQYNSSTINDFTNPNNSLIVRVHPGAYCTGTGGSVGSIDSGAVPMELNISHQDIRTEGKLTLENSISLNSNSTNAGNPWDGGTSGAPAIIDITRKNVIKLAPSSVSTSYYSFTGAPSAINGQEITVVNENYSTFPIPAIIIQPAAADMPIHSCGYGKGLKLYYDADRGTKPGWISVQDLGCTPYQLYTPTWVGWASESGPFQPTSYCAFQAIGRKVFLWFYATGPLYAEAPAGVNFTVPWGFTCASAVPHPIPHNLIRAYNGSSWGAGCCNVYGSYISCFPDIAESPWAASGTDRVVSGEIFYEAIP